MSYVLLICAGILMVRFWTRYPAFSVDSMLLNGIAIILLIAAFS